MSAAAGTEHANKALIRRWFEEVWNQGREDLIEQLRAPDTLARGLGENNVESRGVEPFRAFYTNLRGAFPDLHVTLEDMIAEADKVSVRISMEGTHTGHILAAVTGRRVKAGGIILVRIADGRIAEAWNQFDQLGILKQIGALPAEPEHDRFLAQRP